MAAIRYVHITKQFGSVSAVADLNLDVIDGEFVALLGPSGCGKTTTLRLLAGLESPSAGQIFIGEREVTLLPAYGRDLAMVFQDYALYPHMTVAQNIGYPLKVRHTEAATMRKRVGEVADLLQIGHLLERRPGQLSGGQQQRVSVARALVYQPQAFLFDEPLSNLDAKLRLDARGFLKNLQRTLGITSIYVTHDQSEAMALADKIAVMDRGKIVQYDAPLEVYHRPKTAFVASFIGSPPMNLLNCTIEGDGARLATGPLPLGGRKAMGAAQVGFRAERVGISTDNVGGVPAKVYAVQPLGGETLITLQIGDELVSARQFGDEIPTFPEQVTLHIAPEHLSFYDAQGDLIG